MANFDELANLIPIQNAQHQQYFQRNPRIRNNKIINSFELSDSAFVKNYRLTKNLTNILIRQLCPHLKIKKRSSDLDASTKASYLD
ncbi:unnamed protein product [Macrosiphum euphorbiae]|uniref:LAGLIDADG homing endonuclease n=1 Tax=Macrosiphum euphorbiae TaxID=13131 RepID=A0AAV0XTN3_9HEMI|nr:unnamed protein product [Macrosiphum euphorbiae]